MYLACKATGEGLQMLQGELKSPENVEASGSQFCLANERISYAPFPRMFSTFMAHLSEPLISVVAV
jgi:hypothetical protein